MTTTSKRFLARLLVVAVLISVGPVAASAGDESFSSVVKHIKSNYHGKQQGFLGFVSLARLVVKVIRPAGVKNFKVTMLKDLDYSRAARPETPEFHTALLDKIHTIWSPLIRFSSPREKQWTYIYVTQEKKKREDTGCRTPREAGGSLPDEVQPRETKRVHKRPEDHGDIVQGRQTLRSGLALRSRSAGQ